MKMISLERKESKLIRYLALAIYYGIARFLPNILSFKLGRKMRYLLVKRIFKKCGNDVNIERNVFFGLGNDIEIGSGSGIGRDCYIAGIGAGGNVIIGQDVMIAPETIILTLSHEFIDLKSIKGTFKSTSVVIEDNVWIGIRSIILPGIRIGRFSIIGAGGVVAKDIPPFVVAGGVPARVIKSRH